ncbi:unnamed protein product, partial [Ectocarpus sp. 13 AM-2016]
NACNSTRPSGSLSVPPLEEWDGLSGIYDNGLCRFVQLGDCGVRASSLLLLRKIRKWIGFLGGMVARSLLFTCHEHIKKYS